MKLVPIFSGHKRDKRGALVRSALPFTAARVTLYGRNPVEIWPTAALTRDNVRKARERFRIDWVLLCLLAKDFEHENRMAHKSTMSEMMVLYSN